MEDDVRKRLVSSGLSNDVGHLFNLLQGSLVGTQSLLGQLLGSLLTGVSDQFDQSSFVWSQTSNLRNNASDESGSLGQSTLSVRDLWGNVLLDGLVTLVQADSNTWTVSKTGHWRCGQLFANGMGTLSLENFSTFSMDVGNRGKIQYSTWIFVGRGRRTIQTVSAFMFHTLGAVGGTYQI